MLRFLLILSCLILVACKEEQPEASAKVRGLKAYKVQKSEEAVVRRFPAVLEPAELSPLAFEVGGTVDRLDLDVGQRVKAGEVIARLDTASLDLQVETAQAALRQAEVVANDAQDTLKRQETLLQSGTVTRAAVDSARTQAESAVASLTQARKSLESAEENLQKATLAAPFDGIVNSVDTTSFATVSAGAPIATIYSADDFEVSFSVSFDTINELAVGKAAAIRLADRPDIVLGAVVSETGSRADAVSSFPIVLTLEETHPLLKAGMAVEASMEFSLPAAEGLLLPISSLIRDGKSGRLAGVNSPAEAGVFVFDETSSTVTRRTVTVGGVRENSIIVIDGLEPGEYVASAGVSFLTDGQAVNLLGAGE